MEKWCPRCEQLKPLEQFPDNGNGAKYGYCKLCKSNYMFEYHQAHPGNYFESNLKRACKQRGITTEQYWAKLLEQGDACAICRDPTPGSNTERFCIDHDHETGLFRGLLCGNCNRAIGLLQDRVEILEAARNYLLKFKEQHACGN